jgi:hypothetical protein
MARATRRRSLYSVHPGVQMVQDWIASLPEKTGRSLDDWIELVKRQGPKEEKARRAWLKEEHGLGTNAAYLIVERAEGKPIWDADPETYLRSAEGFVEAMFAGNKAGLRPLYDQLLQLGLGLAPDVKACPCKTIVPFYRNHVFAQIKPATRTRIDLGFALGDTPVTGWLIATGGLEKGDRITHRIPISAAADIDAEVKKWLWTAYQRDA